jgi:hypothetical protein
MVIGVSPFILFETQSRRSLAQKLQSLAINAFNGLWCRHAAGIGPKVIRKIAIGVEHDVASWAEDWLSM